MIAIVHSIYSQSVHAPTRDAGLMDNDAERYCTTHITYIIALIYPTQCIMYNINSIINYITTTTNALVYMYIRCTYTRGFPPFFGYPLLDPKF